MKRQSKPIKLIKRTDYWKNMFTFLFEQQNQTEMVTEAPFSEIPKDTRVTGAT